MPHGWMALMDPADLQNSAEKIIQRGTTLLTKTCTQSLKVMIGVLVDGKKKLTRAFALD